MRLSNINKFIITLALLLNFTQTGIAAENFTEEQLPQVSSERVLNEPVIKQYDYTSTKKIPIVVRIDKRYKSDKNTRIGDELTFTVRRNVYCDGKLLIKRGTKTHAKITHFIRRGMNGIPSIVMLEGFSFENLDSKKLDDKFIKRGFDNTLFVLPIKWVLTPFPPTGSLANFIIGCEAVIDTHDNIVLYYYPDWIVE